MKQNILNVSQEENTLQEELTLLDDLDALSEISESLKNLKKGNIKRLDLSS